MPGQIEPGRDHSRSCATDEPTSAESLVLHDPPPSQVAVPVIETLSKLRDIPDSPASVQARTNAMCEKL